jgi:hypothetical protein
VPVISGRDGNIPRHRAIAIVMASGALIRWIFVFQLLHTAGFSWQWGGEAASIATAIVRGEGFASPYNVSTGPTALMAPLYPVFLAGLLDAVGSPQRAAILAVSLNVLWSILVCLPLLAIGENHRTGLGFIAATLWALSPLFGYSEVVYFWCTSLYTLMLVALMWATLSLHPSVSMPLWAGYGVFAGLTLLLDPAHSLAWSVAVIAIGYVRHLPWRGVMLAAVAALITIAPWCIRNSLLLHQATYVRAYVGYEFLRGLTSDPFDRPTAIASSPGRKDLELSSLKELGEPAYMLAADHRAWNLVRTTPIRTTLWKTLRHVVVYWTAYQSAGHFLWLKYFCYSLVGILGIFGIFELARSQADLGLLILASAFIAIFPLPYYIGLSDPRHRVPIEPLCYLLGSVGCASYFARHRENRFAAPRSQPRYK